MDESSIINIVLIFLLVLLSAFFSATETAFSSANKIRIKHYASQGNKKAIMAVKILDDYDTAISAILIGNNIVNIAATAVGTIFFTNIFGASGVAIATIVMTIIVLFFGEITPKSLAKLHSEKFVLSLSFTISLLIKVFYPIIFILMKFKNIFTKNLSKSSDLPSVTEDELKYIIDEIEDEGILTEHASELVQSALEFNDITVSEVLTPRVDVVSIDITENAENIKNIIFDEGYSRLPVFEKNIDNIVGIINEKDFMKAYINGNFNIKNIIQKTLFVPPKKGVSELLKELQYQKIHMAIVIDQYGGTIGIVTIEDIIEELVGEIWDESDEIENDIALLENGDFIANGNVNIYDLLEFFEISDNIYDGESQSLSGFALDYFEKIPKNGDSFEFHNLKVTVDKILEQRIVSFIIKPVNTDKTVN